MSVTAFLRVSKSIIRERLPIPGHGLSHSGTRWASSQGARVGRVVPRKKEEQGISVAIKAGAPFVLFSLLAAWVVSNAVDGKLKEMEAWQGKTSKSVRQAKLEEEHEEMMDRLNKIVTQDFDNTKRIKRPQEILEERRQERERRNRWYRRLYRWAFRLSAES